jgi:hypothetical protein
MNLSLSDKSNIERLISQLPDLEELLTMSIPAFCDENDDSLIVYKDKTITEDNSPYWQIDQHEVGAEKRVNTPDENPTFNNVTFSSKGIQITGCNDVFKEMVKNQINKEYTQSDTTITGPITLGLLCELKKLNKDPAVLANIDNEITNIITNFCKTRDLDFSIQPEKRQRDDYGAIVDVSEQNPNKKTRTNKKTKTKNYGTQIRNRR